MSDNGTPGAGDGAVAPADVPGIPDVVQVSPENPTAKGHWKAVLAQVLPEPTPLPLRNVHLAGPFENAGFQGLLTTYPPEQGVDLTAVYEGKAGEVSWRRAQGLDGLLQQPADLSQWLPPDPWSVFYVYAEVEVEEPLHCGVEHRPSGERLGLGQWGVGSRSYLSPSGKAPARPRLCRFAARDQHAVA
ncbi:MAG: hypothetical protein GY851_25775 [bacterium]|nr:hypothetical protein [bacterium]